MKFVPIFISLILALAPLSIAGTQTDDGGKGLAIAVEADKRDAGFGDSRVKLLMILKNKRGQESRRKMRTRTLEVKGDGDKSLIIFDTPRDVKGTAMLTYSHKTGDDDQWLYLPALKRVKRISSSNKSGSFMGSEFSYEDLGSQEVEEYAYKWLRNEPCPTDEYRQVNCMVVEYYPVDKTSGYTRQVVWMDEEEYRLLKIDFYDKKSSLLKTLVSKKYRKYAKKYWRPMEMQMTNHQNGKSTRLIFEDYRFRSGLAEKDFTQANLKRVR